MHGDRRPKIIGLGLFVAGALVGASACAPAATPSPTAAPAKPAATTAPAKPAASPVGKPAPSKAEGPAPSVAKPVAKFDQAAWDQVVAAAKREGRVAIIGPTGTDVRDGLTTGFQKAYPDIQVEFDGQTGATAAPKILGQLGAGQFLTDLHIAGTTTILDPLMPAGALEPIRPFLVGPDVSDPTLWRGGDFGLADDAKMYNLFFGARVQTPFIYNPQVVRAAEFSSYRDLLDPKWRGKIGMREPTQAGGSLDILTFVYTLDALGKEYLRQLFQQEILILRDDRQTLDFVARGERPIAVGPNAVTAVELKGRGLPIELFPGESMREGAFVTASNGSMAVVKNPPHPNALKVYLNYLLSRQGQHEWSLATGLSSLRRDVPRDHIPEFLVPKDSVQYRENHLEPYVKLRDEVVPFLQSVIPS